MGVPTYLDAAAIGLPAILGLLGAWLGFGRSLVSWPIRWLVPLFGACVAAVLTAVHLAVNAEFADLLYLSGTTGKAVAGMVAFLVTFVLLAMFMSNLRERVLVWIGHRRIGSMERVLGALSGIACGLLLVVCLIAIPYTFYGSFRPDRREHPAWMREAASLPYIESAGEMMRRAVLSYLIRPKEPRER